MTTPARITAGPERTLLENTLDRGRAALVEKVRELSAEQSRRRLVASATTPIGLIKHAAAAERIWFQHYLAGLPEAECDGYATPGAGSFAVSDDETLNDVIAEFERASRRSATIVAPYDLAHTVHHPRAGIVSVRWIYLFLIAEYGRHTGHADILVEQINDPITA
ncbi:DinB family protein [Nocardia sp. NPDC051052]|uniref:DinB family protein n=1 Tax=Nocardia sp. NPDC051052 TaxID=3364322 RepID=UPI00379F067F